MALKDWKKSQTSSGYYMKRKGELPLFLRFNHNDDGSWDVDLREGLNGEFENLTTKETKSQALAYARNYMRNN